MTIELANRLVGGLASENVRWAESVADFKEQEKTLPGDVLLTTAFVSYMGCFTRKYRDNLMNGKWLPFLKGQSVCSRCRKIGFPALAVSNSFMGGVGNNEVTGSFRWNLLRYHLS